MRRILIYPNIGHKGQPVDGWFHVFAVYSNNDASSPYAVVEHLDGSVQAVDPSQITFIHPGTDE